MIRRRLYTEHKYVSFRLSEFSRTVAKTDFADNHCVDEVMTAFGKIRELMHGHAKHEDNVIHPLLKEKGSLLCEKIEVDHHQHDASFEAMNELLAFVKSSADENEKIKAGYEYYLAFLNFEAHNLQHQEYEEKIMMPELHRLYSDEEILARVDGPVYAVMSAEHMIGMMKELFPHFNREDKYGMLNDIRLAQAEKFHEAWQDIRPFLEKDDYPYLALKFSINSEKKYDY